MTDKKEHLKIDLNFLDKNETPRNNFSNVPLQDDSVSDSDTTAKNQPPVSGPISTGYQYNWKNIFIIGGIIFLIGWAIFSDNGSSSSTSTSGSSYTPSANSGNVTNGQYSCSSYDSNQADALDPSDSKLELDFAQSAISTRSNELDQLKREIDNSYVNEYSSQYEIDNFNEQVDTYNAKLASYKRDAASLSARIDQFNAQIERRNNYLITHCTKAY